MAPGLALAVVSDEAVLEELYFGVRDLEADLPLTPETRFYIASVTKSFTAAAVALAAAEGALELDAPISDLLPDLALPASIPSSAISLRDLLRHTGGVSAPAVNFVTAHAGYTDRDHLMALFSDSVPVDRRFAYTNIGYVLAGLALEASTGADWRAAVRTRVLEPLGLDDTGFSTSSGESPFAAPYAAEVGETRRLRPKTDRVMHSAGGMVSTLPDLSRWLRVIIGEGTIDGYAIFPAPLIRELISSQVHLTGGPSVVERFSGFQRRAYGLGWYLGGYRGEVVLQCFGSHAGYRAHVSFMPRHRVGVVVLQNEGKAGLFLPDLVAREVYDRILDGGPRDEKQDERLRSYLSLIPTLRGEVAPTDLTRPRPLGEEIDPTRFVGLYDGGRLGRLLIERRGGGLHAQVGELDSFLEPIDDLVFRADFTPGMIEALPTLTFAPAVEGTSPSVELSVAGGVVFSRVDAAGLPDLSPTPGPGARRSPGSSPSAPGRRAACCPAADRAAPPAP